MVISQEGKKRKAVEDFINDFKFPAKKDRPSPVSRPVDQGFKVPASGKDTLKNGAAKVSVPEFQSPTKAKKTSLSSSDTDSDRLEFVIDTKGDEDLRDRMDPDSVQATKSSAEKKKKKKKAKSYLDDL